MLVCSFLKVFNKALVPSQETLEASPQLCSWAEEPCISGRGTCVQASSGDEKNKETSSLDGDRIEAKPSLHLPSECSSITEDSDDTDNSSGKTVSQVCTVGVERTALVVWVSAPNS